MTTWVEIERDERFRVPLITYRCRSCRRLGVSTNPFLTMTPCACAGKR